MNVTTATTLSGLAASAAMAWSLGGREGTGVLAGYLGGAFAAGVAMLLQRAAARRRPHLLLHAVLGGFLLKAVAMLVLTLAVRFVEPLANAADARWFLYGFAGATLLVLVPATFETLRTVDPARARAARTAVEARTS
jgi:hypothetical protein